jgi:monofunctional biosynthetic peptidoglycan transglycosylase
VVVEQARLTLHVRGADRYDGMLQLGAGAAPVSLPWRAELKAEGLKLHVELAPTPLQPLLALFGDALPEMKRARVEGRFSLVADATLSEQGLMFQRLVPRLADVSVDGLGTEALADADPGASCRPQPAGGRVEGWIQNAVVAAEDQRFFEHPGYDLTDAWWPPSSATRTELSRGDPTLAPHGASTITQQLAKLLVTGDDRSAACASCASCSMRWRWSARWARAASCSCTWRWLPWGDGVCGAARAAEAHLGRSVDTLGPVTSAWLASLLTNPAAATAPLGAGRRAGPRARRLGAQGHQAAAARAARGRARRAGQLAAADRAAAASLIAFTSGASPGRFPCAERSRSGSRA